MTTVVNVKLIGMLAVLPNIGDYFKADWYGHGPLFCRVYEDNSSIIKIVSVKNPGNTWTGAPDKFWEVFENVRIVRNLKIEEF